tara:strand:- start:74 stop:643 length:570 start_codon:yes stop_codon:yes gene_type:complete
MWSNVGFTEDISDFEIDGISIGDSALKYLDEEEIKKEIKESIYMYDYLKEPEKFGHIAIRNGLKKYSFITLMVSINDEYIIEDISGNIISTISSKKELDICLKQMQEIEKEFSQIFNKYEKFENITDHPIDPTGRSKVHYIEYTFENGDSAQLQCFDFEEKLRIENNWADGLSVVVRKNKVSKWLADRK